MQLTSLISGNNCKLAFDVPFDRAFFTHLPSSIDTTISTVSPFGSQTALLVSRVSEISSSNGFEPVLNVPALVSFVVIAFLFVSLQVRISSIGDAADRRNEALDNLRKIKSQQLEGKATNEQVDDALNQYRQTFDDVERLRSVLPGVRIRPPPATAGLAQKKMEENEAAAKLFLGIEPVENETDKNSNEKKALSPFLSTVLVLVAISQIGLLLLLVNDPMSSSLDSPMASNTLIDTLVGFE